MRRRGQAEESLPRVTSSTVREDLAAGRLARSWTIPASVRLQPVETAPPVPQQAPAFTAAHEQSAHTAALSLDLGNGQYVRIDEPAVIGRRSATPPARRSVLIDDPGRSVSREHAAVRPTDDGGLLIEDLGSANGTGVVRMSGSHEDSIPGHPVIAYPGDVIMIGDFAARLALS